MNHKPALFIIGIILLAANLRAPIVAFGPLVEEIIQATGSSATVMGVIGTLPVLTFAACSSFAAKLARRFGLENVLLFGLVLIGVGGFVRSMRADSLMIMVGTVILCAGIAMGNVLLAAVIKRDQPNHIERMTALQMFSFSILSAIASAFAVPLAKTLGWQFALGIWSVCSIPAFVVWWRMRRRRGPHTAAVVNPSEATFNIWRSVLAWKISAYTGLQSMLFYSMVTWLATIVAARGFSETEAGLYNTLFQLIALPTVVFITPLAERYPHMHHLLIAAGSMMFIGLLGVWYMPVEWLWLCVIVLGIGACASFTFCLMLFALRGQNAVQSAALSGMGQTVGYMIAAFGPFTVGWLLESSGGWTLPIYGLLAVTIILMSTGWFAGQRGRLNP
ncbi:MFS transporter [Suttonella sp. R2A3]|uniref:CynX/NimT family MFS transporter n=1 Tax=Suttonella sp. R2A3 TaxID=2908648 RepID=UPI001F47C18A|nr:MFS transporter [Suttonella sp. R2A3]UJF23643.1 MFS transporter [Suttonella sp. R2A3]